jgi:hypothetical protein
MRFVKYLALVMLVFLMDLSCGKIEKLPPEPSIKFRSFEIFDSITYLGDMKAGRLNSILKMETGTLDYHPLNIIPDWTQLTCSLRC